MKLDRQTVVSPLAFSLTAAAAAQGHTDIDFTVIDDHITTGHYDVNTARFISERVFGAQFGRLFDNFTNDVGFHSSGDITTTSAITFNILSAVREWDGDAFSRIADERIRIGDNGYGFFFPRLTPTSDVVTRGFGIGVFSHEWHQHFDYTLLQPADDGIYLLELTLFGDSPTTQESLPFWIVFNKNSDESEHDAAIEWVRDNLVPAPGTAGALFLLAGAVGVRRRRGRLVTNQR